MQGEGLRFDPQGNSAGQKRCGRQLTGVGQVAVGGQDLNRGSFQPITERGLAQVLTSTRNRLMGGCETEVRCSGDRADQTVLLSVPESQCLGHR